MVFTSKLFPEIQSEAYMRLFSNEMLYSILGVLLQNLSIQYGNTSMEWKIVVLWK